MVAADESENATRLTLDSTTMSEDSLNATKTDHKSSKGMSLVFKQQPVLRDAVSSYCSLFLEKKHLTNSHLYCVESLEMILEEAANRVREEARVSVEHQGQIKYKHLLPNGTKLSSISRRVYI